MTQRAGLHGGIQGSGVRVAAGGEVGTDVAVCVGLGVRVAGGRCVLVAGGGGRRVFVGGGFGVRVGVGVAVDVRVDVGVTVGVWVGIRAANGKYVVSSPLSESKAPVTATQATNTRNPLTIAPTSWRMDRLSL